MTVMIFISYVHLYCLLLNVQQCCYTLVKGVANKIQESLNFKQYYQEDGIRWEKRKTKTKSGTKLVRDVSLISEATPENSGQTVT